MSLSPEFTEYAKEVAARARLAGRHLTLEKLRLAKLSSGWTTALAVVGVISSVAAFWPDMHDYIGTGWTTFLVNSGPATLLGGSAFVKIFERKNGPQMGEQGLQLLHYASLIEMYLADPSGPHNFQRITDVIQLILLTTQQVEDRWADVIEKYNRR